MIDPDGAPLKPTPEQCNTNERVSIPNRPHTRAHAVWWPQMGGYHARAVLTAGECPEVWVWHDGAFPFSDDGKPGHSPAHLFMSDADQWVEMFEMQKAWAAEVRGDEPEPYVWVLPQGVTREQAQEVYEKIVAWGLWEVDPGGFKIRTYEEAHGPCEPVPCPPFTEQALGAVYPPPNAKITGAGVVDTQVNPDGSATVTWEHGLTGPTFGVESTPAGPTLFVADALDDPRRIRPTYTDRIEPV